MNNNLKKIFASLLVLAMVVTVVPNLANVKGNDEANTYSVTYQFANQTAGSAYGKVAITTEEPGEYSIYWGDDNGEKLKSNNIEYSELGTCTTTQSKLSATYSVISEYTAVPEGAKEVLLVDEDEDVVATYDIPQNKQLNEGASKYKFALMSDVHYNRYPEEGDNTTNDSAVRAFDRALKFVNEQGIKLVTLTGDLSNQGEISSYNKFNAAVAKYPGMVAYTCMGNHDVSWTKSYKTTVPLFAANVNKTRTTDKNVKNINSNGVDFVYQNGDDIFIFFSQTKASYGKNRELVTPEQLNWLERMLNRYANKKIYLYYHTFLAAENGDVTKGVGNLQTPLGYTYDLTYYFGNPDEVRFRKLLNKYPNITLFGGHSHWSLTEQQYNPYANIGNINSKKTGASIVHIPSVTAPRTAVLDKTVFDGGQKRYENYDEKSEGYIATRYANSTVYTAVDFMSGKYLAYATYINLDGKTSTPQKEITIGKSKIKSVGKAKKVSKKSKYYKAKIKYAKVANAASYKVQYSTSKKFKSGKTKTKTVKATSCTITKLKRKTTYYIRVRAVGSQFGYTLYGKWSTTKKVKTKK